MNFIYLHTHDTGRWIEPYGFPVRTPHLRRLAERGTTFANAFAAAPTCSPSRTALMTGRYPHEEGVHGLAHLGFPLRDFSRTLPRYLAEQGYETFLCGIQHIAGSGANDRFDIGYTWASPKERTEAEESADHAVSILRENRGKPFFLDVGMFETHRYGWEGGGFSALGPRVPAAEGHPPPPPIPDTPRTRADFADYAAAVERVDTAVGRVLEALRESGQDHDTLVVFTTDHGPPFPKMKSNLTDFGLGVSLILAGPAPFCGGGRVEGPVSQLDLFPTFCRAANLPEPSWLRGRPLQAQFRRDAASEERPVFGENNFHQTYLPERTIRSANYRLIARFCDDRRRKQRDCDPSPSKDEVYRSPWGDEAIPIVRLYDCENDPLNESNIAGVSSHTEIRRELLERLRAWMHETRDPLLEGPLPVPPKRDFPGAGEYLDPFVAQGGCDEA